MIQLNDRTAGIIKSICISEIERYEKFREKQSDALRAEMYKILEKPNENQFIDFLRLLRDIGLQDYALVNTQYYKVTRKETKDD